MLNFNATGSRYLAEVLIANFAIAGAAFTAMGFNSPFATGTARSFAMNFVVPKAILAAEPTTTTPTFPVPLRIDEAAELSCLGAGFFFA